MIFKNTWLWIMVAAVLLLASFWHYQHARHRGQPSARVLPQLNSAMVGNVQVQVETQLEIRAERTNDQWLLTRPLRYPAETEKVEALLKALENLTPAIYITRAELNRPNAEEEYGFGAPQATIVVKQGDYRAQVLIGARTAPGDQMFLQVVGDEGIYVVDAGLLSMIPRKADDWRGTRLLPLKGLAFDRLMVTNSGKGFEFRKDGTNKWKIVTSDFSARAEGSKVENLLKTLEALRAEQFMPTDPKSDLESFGLQNPEFQLAVAEGTNVAATLQFGKSQTNDSTRVFARKAAENTVTLVSRTNLTPWPSWTDFRDTSLIGAMEKPRSIEIHGRDNFSLIWQTNDIWKVVPQNFIADTNLTRELLQLLSDLQIVQFVKDVVPEQALAQYGLDKPGYTVAPDHLHGLEYVLRGNPESTNHEVRLQFGTISEDKLYVRRSDETAVYAVNLNDARYLARSSWQLRDRQIWKFSIEDLAGITIQQNGTNCHLLRKGDHQWALAPGSQGIVEPLAVEETLLDLVDLRAVNWIGRAVQDLAAFGFSTNDQRLTLEFKNGERRAIQLSQGTIRNFGVAAAAFEGETWVFAILPSLRRDMINYLSIPAAKTL